MNAAHSFCDDQVPVRERHEPCWRMHWVRTGYDTFSWTVTRQVHAAVELSRHLRGGVVELDDAALHRGAFQELHVDPLSILIHRHVVQAGAGASVERFRAVLLSLLHEAPS